MWNLAALFTASIGIVTTYEPHVFLLNLETYFGIVEKYWLEKKGIVAAILLVLGIETPFLKAIEASATTIGAVMCITTIALLVLWFVSRKLPKTKANKVGFVVCLACDDEHEAKRVRQDFILSLRRLIKAGKTGPTFQFIEVPSHYSARVVDVDDAQQLRFRTKAHFLLYGLVRLRQFNGKDHHFVELDGLVAHRPISENIQKKLAAEFSELLPRRVAIAKENDLLAFQFTTEWAEVVAKYVIGIAAAVSGDLEYAEYLYKEVEERSRGVAKPFPVFAKLRERVPVRLLEIKEARARLEYELWTESHEEIHIERLGVYLEGTKEISDMPGFLALNAIFAFLRNKDTREACHYLNQYPIVQRDVVWHLNMAFLHAYEGDLKRAAKHYRIAETMQIEGQIVGKIEDFLVFVLKKEPDKYQLSYCLGFFNWKVKGDRAQAIEDFREFVNAGRPEEFSKEKALASRWTEELVELQKTATGAQPGRTSV